MSVVKRYLQSTLLLFVNFGRRSKKKDWIAGLATGSGVVGLGAGHLFSVLGLSAVVHSSGAMILTGSSGYIAGTYGAAMLVAFLMAPLTLLLLFLCVFLGIGFVLRRWVVERMKSAVRFIDAFVKKGTNSND